MKYLYWKSQALLLETWQHFVVSKDGLKLLPVEAFCEDHVGATKMQKQSKVIIEWAFYAAKNEISSIFLLQTGQMIKCNKPTLEIKSLANGET